MKKQTISTINMKKICRKYLLTFLLGGFIVFIFFKINKDYWLHHHHQAVVALQESRYNDVITSCDEALRLEPNHPNAYGLYVKKAKAYNKLHSYKLAIEASNKAIEINPKYEEAYLTKVDALFALNQDDELANVLEEILYLNPYSPLKGLLNSLRKEHGKWCY